MAFLFELVSPERLVLSDELDQVVVPGSEGELTILAHHAPLLTTLKPGIIAVSTGTAAAKRFFVRGGFAEVGARGLTVLAERAIPVEELDKARLASDIREAEEDVADATDDHKRVKASTRLAQLREVEAALSV